MAKSAKFDLTTKERTAEGGIKTMVLVLPRVEVTESASIRRKNRENYEAVVRKINHQLRLRSRPKTEGQQVTIWKLIYLIKEAIRLRAKLANGSAQPPTGHALGLINGLEVFISSGCGEAASKKALKLVVEICKFFCPEVEVETLKDL